MKQEVIGLNPRCHAFIVLLVACDTHAYGHVVTSADLNIYVLTKTFSTGSGLPRFNIHLNEVP